MTAIILSVLFLISYILHHLFAGDTHFGGTGAIKVIYYIILATHILLAGIAPSFSSQPTGHCPRAIRSTGGIARRVWPIWLFVSLSGVVVYLLISPYY